MTGAGDTVRRDLRAGAGRRRHARGGDGARQPRRRRRRRQGRHGDRDRPPSSRPRSATAGPAGRCVQSMTGFGAGAADGAEARASAVEIRGVNQRFLDVRIARAARVRGVGERAARARARAGGARSGRRHGGAHARRGAPSLPRRRCARSSPWRTSTRRAARHAGSGCRARSTLADVLRLPELFEVARAPAGPRAASCPALQRALAAALRAFDARAPARGAPPAARHAAAASPTLAHRSPADPRPRAGAAARRSRRRMRGARRRASRPASTIDPRAARAGGRRRSPSAATSPRSWCASRATWRRSAAALRGRGPVGKRIEFLLQEIQRELNTTGAKAADVEINAPGARGQGRGGEAARAGAERRVSRVLITISGLPGQRQDHRGAARRRGRSGSSTCTPATSSAARPRRHGLSARGVRRAAPRPTRTIDRELDRPDARRGRARGEAVLEGRLAAFMADRAGATALKVFLDASEAVRGRADHAIARAAAAAERLREIQAREASDRRRYRDLYGVDYHDLRAVRSRAWRRTGGTPEELARAIVERRARASPTTADDPRRAARQGSRLQPRRRRSTSIERAYEFSARGAPGPAPRSRASPTSSTRCRSPASSPSSGSTCRASRPGCCTTRSRTRSRRSTQIEELFGERDRRARRRRHQDRPDQLHLARGEAGGELPQDDPRDGARHPRHPDQARRPHAQHAHARRTCGPSGRTRSRRRRSTSTRRSRTASASTGSRASSRTTRSATCTPRSTTS